MNRLAINSDAKIAVITRLTTGNAGNELLSNNLIRFLERRYPHHTLLRFERNPSHLMQFSASGLGPDPIQTFEKWKGRLRPSSMLLDGTCARREGSAASGYATLNRTTAKETRWFGFHVPTRPKTGLRRHMARLGMFHSAFEQRLGLLLGCNVILYNPAGELNPSSVDIPLRTFLELSLAHENGARIIITSHTVQTQDRGFLSILGSLYDAFDAVFVRETQSLQLLRRAGVRHDRVNLCPDIGFLTEAPPNDLINSVRRSEDIEDNTIGVSVNALRAQGHEVAWTKLISKLKEREGSIMLISNEYETDKHLMQHIAQTCNINMMRSSLDAEKYSALVANCKAVVSARLHTMILALINGVPFVAVEPITHKLSGILEDINYPIRAAQPSKQGWIDEVLDAIGRVNTEREELKRICKQEGARLKLEIEAHLGGVMDTLLYCGVRGKKSKSIYSTSMQR